MSKMIIPKLEPEVIAARARKRGGDTEKVATTSLKELYVDGVRITSRYNKADEYQVLGEVVEGLSSKMRARIASVLCDSKACWVIIVCMRIWNASLARDIAYQFDRGMLIKNKGHNGITVTNERWDHDASVNVDPNYLDEGQS